MSSSGWFFVGLLTGATVTLVVSKLEVISWLPKRAKQPPVSTVPPLPKEKVEEKLRDYMEIRKNYRKHTTYATFFGIKAYGGVKESDPKELVGWLSTHANGQHQLPGIESFASGILNRDVRFRRVLTRPIDFYQLVRLLDAVVDLQLVDELESTGGMSSEKAARFREPPLAERDHMLEKLHLSEQG